MKIVQLTAENIKKLRAVEITPSGDVVVIAGRNGAGKTSVMDSIWWALAGTANIQGQPIRKGETKARIRLNLGDIVVERRFSPTGTNVVVESADGARFPSPQRMLDSLLGELSFDPLAFARMQPREQFDELRRVAKLEVDIDKLKGLNRADYERRTEINRDAKTKAAQADGVVVPPPVEGDPIDEAALVDELQRAGDTNADIQTRKARRDNVTREAAAKRVSAKEKRERAEKLRSEAAALDAAANDIDAIATEMEEKLRVAEPLPDPVDVSAIRQRIEAAKQTNAAITTRERAIQRRDELRTESENLSGRSSELTSQIEAREKAIQTAIQKAELPVPGLGFGDGIVTYNDVPLEQASSAEQLKVSMSIAMAANPKLRVIRITDGSLLDDDSMRAIGEMAKAADFQVWCEVVSSSGKVGIVIDDGAVVSTPESRGELELEGHTG